MLKFLDWNLGFLRSRLSRRVTYWVFLSLILTEGVLLIPSYQNRKRELLAQLEQVSHELVTATKQSAMIRSDMEAVFEDLGKKLNPDSVIEGGALYDIQGNLISAFGDVPELSGKEVIHSDRKAAIFAGGHRYDVAWGSQNFSNQYILVVRHDSSEIGIKLLAYLARICLLVVVIAVVVTGSTMFVLGTMVIGPFLKLRQDFALASEAISQNLSEPKFATLGLHPQDEMGDVFQEFHQMFERICEEIKRRRDAENALRSEQEKSEKLLLNVLPAAIAQELKQGQRAIAQTFDQATILFADLVNFTCLATQIPADELVCLLNDIFSRFDRLAEHYHLEKIKTIGDAYMVVAGVPTPRSDHAEAMMEMALAMQGEMEAFNRDRQRNFQLRIGINTGSVVAGVIGIQKFAYDLWGDAVNLASRMESHGLPGKIQLTEATYQLLSDRYHFEHRGKIAVKGRGEMDTYFLLGPLNP